MEPVAPVYLLLPTACPSLCGPALTLKHMSPMFPFHLPYKDLSESFPPLAGKLLESRGLSLPCACSSLGLLHRVPESCRLGACSTYKHAFQRLTPWIQVLVLQFAGLSEGEKVTQTLKFKALKTSFIKR